MPKTQFKSSEDVAKDYMIDLIGGSIVMVPRRISLGGIKACRIHDLLHEFCVTKAKEENFLLLVRGYDELSTFNVPQNLRCLSANSEPEHFTELERLKRELLEFHKDFACDGNIMILVLS